MKYFLGIILLVAVAAAAVWFWQAHEKAADASATSAATTGKVQRINLEKIITANGSVASNRDVDIKCQASGKVIKLPFDISNRVKIGDLLMELDPVDQQRSLDQAKAQVDASTARLAQARTNFAVATDNLTTSKMRLEADVATAQARDTDAKNKLARTQELFNQQLSSGEDLETAKTTAAAADANLQQSQAALAEWDQQKMSLDTKLQDIATATAQLAQDNAKLSLAQTQRGYCEVKVPEDEQSKVADYRVSALSVQVGTIVQSGSSGFSGGTTVMTLSDVSHMYVLASVQEADIGQIADPVRGGTPQKARITVDAYAGKVFEGEVVRVATKGVTTNNVVTFEVKIEVTDRDRDQLRPGMTATAKVIIASRENALAIPVAAFTAASSRGNNDDAAATKPAASADAPAADNPPQTAPAADGNDAAAAPAASAPATRGGRGRGRGRGRGAGASGPPATQGGTVQVLKAGVKEPETRDVTVGLTDGEFYEVVSGELAEDDDVILNKVAAESRWRGGQGQGGQGRGPGGGILPRGFGGGGGGGGGRGR